VKTKNNFTLTGMFIYSKIASGKPTTITHHLLLKNQIISAFLKVKIGGTIARRFFKSKN